LNAADYSRGAAQVDAANRKMQQGQAGVASTMTQTRTRTAETASAFDRYRQRLDPTYRAQQNLTTGLDRLNAALAKGQITVRQHATLVGQLQQRYGSAATQMTTLQRATTGLTQSVSGLNTAVTGLVVGFAAFSLVGVGRDVIETALAFERIDKTLVAATGSAELAGAEMKLLRAQAEELGLDLRSSALEFAKLAAAAKGTTLEGQGARDIFRAISEASVTLSLSSEQTAGALTAIQQIISKGTVSSEELRGQLGERLPGAFQIAARAMDVSTAKLGKMLQAGEVISDDFLPKFAVELRKTFADALPDAVNSAQSAFNRFGNSVNDLKLELARSGFLDAVVDAMKDIREVMTDPGFHAGIREFGAGIKSAFAFIIDNSELLLRIASAYIGARVGRLAGPAGAAAGAALGFIGPDGAAAFSQGGAEGGYAFAKTGVPPIRQQQQPLGNQFSQRPGSSVNDRLFGGNSSQRPQYSVAPLEVLEKETSQIKKTNEAISSGNKARDTAAAKLERQLQQQQDVQNKINRDFKDYVLGLEQEAVLAGMTVEERRKEESLLRGMTILNRFLTEQEKERILTALELADARAKEVEALEQQQQKLEENVTFIRDEAADAFEAIFTNGKDGVDEFIDYWKKRFIRLLAELAAEALVSPIIVPIIQSIGGLFGGGGGATGGLGANFGASGPGGLGNLTGTLGSLSKSVDSLGQSLGLQGFKPSAGTPEMLRLDAQGLFGTETFLSDVIGGALGGIGIGSSVAGLTGGNSVGGAVGGLVGGALGSFLGPIGSALGAAVGGFLGGLFGGKPTNATAAINFDAKGRQTAVPNPGKETAETRGAINNAAAQIEGVQKALEEVGTVFNDRLTSIAIGVRDPSYIQFASGKLLRTPVGDPNALALAAIKELLRTADYASASIATVAKIQFSSLEELVNALDFVVNTYDVIANARPALTATEQAMKDLTFGLEKARKEAESLGLSVSKLNAGATKLFDFDIAVQIQSITDPVAAALTDFERGAAARLRVAKELGANIVNVERLNALEREAILKQAGSQSVSSLKSLINDIEFGGLSLGVAPEQQYFSALSAYNQARTAALENRSPEAIQEFETQARSFLPIAQSFLGVSTRFADVRSGILQTARDLGTPNLDPNTSAIIAATLAGSTQVVEAVKNNTDETKGLRGEFKELAAYIRTLFGQIANGQFKLPNAA
jgi:tape measure domain-containing protein